ncbi:MAG: hypothetical protein NTU98_07935 [Bacteroidetes bacterium]|nr:hypothetical protein [Bacteroidota bacterium]
MKKEKIKYYKYIGNSQGAYVYGQVYTVQKSDLPDIVGAIFKNKYDPIFELFEADGTCIERVNPNDLCSNLVMISKEEYDKIVITLRFDL